MEDEEKTYRMNAVVLLARRGEDGRVIKDGAALLPDEAAKLLSRIDSADMGQGSFVLLIPQTALKLAGLPLEVWEKAADAGALSRRNIGGQAVYEVDYLFSVLGILPILGSWAGMSSHEAKSFVSKLDAGEKGNVKGI